MREIFSTNVEEKLNHLETGPACGLYSRKTDKKIISCHSPFMYTWRSIFISPVNYGPRKKAWRVGNFFQLSFVIKIVSPCCVGSPILYIYYLVLVLTYIHTYPWLSCLNISIWPHRCKYINYTDIHTHFTTQEFYVSCYAQLSSNGTIKNVRK